MTDKDHVGIKGLGTFVNRLFGAHVGETSTKVVARNSSDALSDAPRILPLPRVGGGGRSNLAKIAVAAVMAGAMIVSSGLPCAAETTDSLVSSGAPIAQTQTAPTAQTSDFKTTFDSALERSVAVRKSVMAQGHVPGELLVKSRIPILRNIGTTLSSLGRAVTSPLTLVEGAVRADGDVAKQGFDDLARGLLGVVGLEHIVMGEYHGPGQGITGASGLPQAYAEAIIEAKQEWRGYSDAERQRDYRHGMKKWHTLSNAKLTSDAGIAELPFLFIGGILHEVDPGSVSDEVEFQGFRSWLWDSPLDVAANTFGMLGGLLLPDSAHVEYARVVGNIIPGPFDPFETAGDGTTTSDGASDQVDGGSGASR